MRTVAAGVVLLLAAVSACSSDEAAPVEVGPLASASAEASDEVTTSATTPDPTASSADSPAADPERPTSGPATSAPSQASDATAFVREFFHSVNQAYLRRDAVDIRRMSAPECGSCAAVAQDIDRLAARGHAVEGRRYIISSAEAAPARSDGAIVVDFRFDSDPYTERDAAGGLVQQFPAEKSRDGQVLVNSARGSLRIAAIRLVDQ